MFWTPSSFGNAVSDLDRTAEEKTDETLKFCRFFKIIKSGNSQSAAINLVKTSANSQGCSKAVKCPPRGKIEQVIAGGENYDGARVLKYDWVKSLYEECKEFDVTFCFIETGTMFEKDGKIYRLTGKRLQSEMACKSGLQHQGRPIQWQLYQPQSGLFGAGEWYQKQYRDICQTCAGRLICNGCSGCGGCKTAQRF
ncbi:MAG: DUF5131 family protein [Alphaproteobacteria bacterium]|nr:DUF5131 family protein [Alphaproteobacteria bacterium]